MTLNNLTVELQKTLSLGTVNQLREIHASLLKDVKELRQFTQEFGQDFDSFIDVPAELFETINDQELQEIVRLNEEKTNILKNISNTSTNMAVESARALTTQLITTYNTRKNNMIHKVSGNLMTRKKAKKNKTLLEENVLQSTIDKQIRTATVIDFYYGLCAILEDGDNNGDGTNLTADQYSTMVTMLARQLIEIMNETDLNSESNNTIF